MNEPNQDWMKQQWLKWITGPRPKNILEDTFYAGIQAGLDYAEAQQLREKESHEG